MKYNRKQLTSSSKPDSIGRSKTADFLSFLRQTVPSTPAQTSGASFPDGGATASQYPQASVPFTGPYSNEYYDELERMQSPQAQSRDQVNFAMENYRAQNPGMESNPFLTEGQQNTQDAQRNNNIDLDMQLSKDARADELIQFPTRTLDPQADFVTNPSNPVQEPGQGFGNKAKGFMQEQFGNNPYLPSEALNVGLAGLSRFTNRREEAKREEELRTSFSNVHELFGSTEQDRGDYMVNLPGVGDPLRPDEHVRKGFNTKVARDGMEVGAEMDMDEEEIERLKAQGYDIEIL